MYIYIKNARIHCKNQENVKFYGTTGHVGLHFCISYRTVLLHLGKSF